MKCLIDQLSEAMNKEQQLKKEIQDLQQQIIEKDQIIDLNQNDILDLQTLVASNYEKNLELEKENLDLNEATAKIFEMLSELTPTTES